ncbi:MAG: hypothetical protein IJQ56_02330 [Synergistaceae bacterium]|nr:hypothetical protein [Synergistaceae bacterium]
MITVKRSTDDELIAKVREAREILFDCSADFWIKCFVSTLDDPEAKKINDGVRKAFTLLNNVCNTYEFERKAI